MSKLITNTIRHTGGSADNITLDNSQNVTVEGNATVDGELHAASGIVQTAQTISTSVTLTANYNAMSVDPTVASGVTVTVPSGATWSII
jgi:hypothetical protein